VSGRFDDGSAQQLKLRLLTCSLPHLLESRRPPVAHDIAGEGEDRALFKCAASNSR
jgi:hypothetical protein